MIYIYAATGNRISLQHVCSKDAAKILEWKPWTVYQFADDPVGQLFSRSEFLGLI